MRSSLRLALQGTIASDVANGLVRMQDLGVELQKDGKFTLDEAKLKTAIANDGGAVSRLLGLHGAADNASLQYLRAGDATKPGTYAIDVTQAAAAADVIGAGFSGVYVDDGTPDTLTIRDLGSANGTYVNNKRISEQELSAGDHIVIGPMVFTIQINGEPSDIKQVHTRLERREASATASGLGIQTPAAAADVFAAGDEEDPIAALEALASSDDTASLNMSDSFPQLDDSKT